MNGPEIWYEALASEHGIVVKTSDPVGTRQRLYAVRKELGDPDLDQITIAQSPTDPKGELWLVKRKSDATEGTIPTGKGDAKSASG